MRVDYPGLLKERLPSGNVRYRVRVEGDPKRRVRLHVKPGDKHFDECYHAARAGIEITPEQEISTTTYGSMKWLTEKYVEELERQVEVGLLSPRTLTKKKGFAKTLEANSERWEYKDTSMRPVDIIKIRDAIASTPAAADGFVTFMKGLFDWALQERLCKINPAMGIGKIDRGKGGSKPWSVEDLKTFREFHQSGSTAHLCLTLLLFTGCRIGDAAVLGKDNETTWAGMKSLKWQPAKRGSAVVTVPILPPLEAALSQLDPFRKTYLLNDYSRSFASGDSLSARFKKWCQQAGLPERSAHGVRKALATLLAEYGCSSRQIMAVLGHTQAQTAEYYTKEVDRAKLTRDAMAALAGMEW